MSRCGDWTPASVPQPAKGRSSPTNTPVFPPSSFVLQFCVVLNILFHWSSTLVHSQLVLCMHFWVWRCIPDVSVKRDVPHILLVLHYLVLPSSFFSYKPIVIRMSKVYHLFFSLHSLNYFHFCFYHCYLVLLGIASYITTAFTLASRNPGLEIEILYYYILHSTVQ